MEQTDLLRPADEVKIRILGPDGEELYSESGTGYHRIEEAIRNTIENARLNVNPEDCVYEVTNETKDVTHEYRINAHGNLKLIV